MSTSDFLNPSNNTPRVNDRTRIPMNSAVQRLKVPPIPGYFLFWWLGKPEVIERAKQAGYTFVLTDEVSLNDRSLGGDAKKSGNTDMGTLVSVVAGSEIGSDGQPVRLYLMKLPEEWHQADLGTQRQRSEKIKRALQGGKLGVESESESDAKSRYVGTENKNIFQTN